MTLTEMQRPSMAALTCALTCTTICATSAPRERPLDWTHPKFGARTSFVELSKTYINNTQNERSRWLWQQRRRGRRGRSPTTTSQGRSLLAIPLRRHGYLLTTRSRQVAKLNNNPPEHLTAPLESTIILKKDPEKRISSDRTPAPTAHPEARRETQPLKAAPPIEATRPPAPAPAPPQDAPTQGPTRPTSNPPLDTPSAPAAPTTTTPFSPYTFTRQRLRELTLSLIHI